MTTLIHDCPHCGASRMSFIVFGAKSSVPANSSANVSNARLNVGLECPSCRSSASATIQCKINSNGVTLASLCNQIANQHMSIPSAEYGIVEFWPKPKNLEIPEYLPSVVEKAFSQGEVNLLRKDCEEAASTMFRRSLDLALKIRFPELNGDLFKKIEKLSQDHIIPATLAEWAHEVRVIGNDGAHDLDGCTQEDAEAARNFVDATLRYLFSLPGMISARRDAKATADNESPTAGQFA